MFFSDFMGHSTSQDTPQDSVDGDMGQLYPNCTGHPRTYGMVSSPNTMSYLLQVMLTFIYFICCFFSYLFSFCIDFWLIIITLFYKLLALDTQNEKNIVFYTGMEYCIVLHDKDVIQLC